MIAIVDTTVQAANPSLPLYPWRAFRNSYSSVRVRNVPRKIGKWNITGVVVQVTYPDGSMKSADAVLTGSVWVATLEGTSTAGTSLMGYKIIASGIDENGNQVPSYCLGRGDVTILEDDGELVPENAITYTRLLSSEPSSPKDGDLWKLSGAWYIWQDGAAWPIGDDSGLISQLSSELSNYVPASRTINSKALSSDLILNAADVGALSGSGDVTLESQFPYPASLTIAGDQAGGGKLVIGECGSAGDRPAQIVLGKQDGQANHGANITLYGASFSGQDGASINLVDNPNAEFVPKLKSEVTIGNVKVRESIGQLAEKLAPVTTTLSDYIETVVTSAYANANTKEY